MLDKNLIIGVISGNIVGRYWSISNELGPAHCRGPGQEQGPELGSETMGFYIMLCTVHTTRGS